MTDGSAPASDELPVPGDEADEIVERLVQRDTVLSVMADLPETHRRALMLREFEGRSHREVAQELEISTSQAKALIHRAKGSFRRLWLEKVADRGGLMGFALLPLLWLAHAANGLRRVADRVGFAAQTAQVAAPEALTSTVTSTAAPAAERRHRAPGRGGDDAAPRRGRHGRGRQDRERPSRAGSRSPRRGRRLAAAPSVADERVAPAGRRRSSPEGDRAATTRSRRSRRSSSPSPSPEPSSPNRPWRPRPSRARSRHRPSLPEPTPAPAPAWSFDFTSSTTSVEILLCSPDAELIGSKVDEREDGFDFSQTIRGGARDAAGDLTWPFSLQQWGQVDADDGQLEFRLTLSSGAGNYLYGGIGRPGRGERSWMTAP